jgi:hypothetical protein
MKGVTVLTDERKKRRIMQIDLTQVAKNPQDFEDIIDVLVAEARKNEPKISFEDVKKNLRKKGKL